MFACISELLAPVTMLLKLRPGGRFNQHVTHRRFWHTVFPVSLEGEVRMGRNRLRVVQGTEPAQIVTRQVGKQL